MTVTEFLLARISEDEAAARAVDDRPWSYPGFTHIARHSPVRVLAECTAKREAIDAAWIDHERIEGEWGMCQSREQMDAKDDVPGVVTALASVYADHPDYRDEWRS